MSILDDRIAAAFGNGVKSDDVAALITETEAAVVSTSEAADIARTRALDPALSAKGVAEARRQMEDAAFARDRLQAAMPRLQERLRKLQVAEEDARRWAAYEKAKAERDKLAEELTRVYPKIVEQLVDLLTRLAANNKALETCNRHARPAGAEYVRSAEDIARGLFAFEKQRSEQIAGAYRTQLPRLVTDMKLPKFEAARGYMFVWPPDVRPVEKPVPAPAGNSLVEPPHNRSAIYQSTRAGRS